jgi:tyrosinase
VDAGDARGLDVGAIGMWRAGRRALATAAVACAGIACAGGAAASAAPPDERPRVRESVTALSEAERERFVEAVLELKRTPSPHDARLSWYDQFVDWHVYLSRCNPLDPGVDHQMIGHGGPMFLPWHREYLLLFEDALRTVSGDDDLTVPYWDWTDPAAFDTVFSEDFMGGDGDPDEGYAVTTGPFRKGKWELVVQNRGLLFGSSATSYLARHVGSLAGPPRAADVEAAFDAAQYDVAPWDDTSDPARSFRNALEGFGKLPDETPSMLACGPDGLQAGVPVAEQKLHNVVHVWVGGSLGVGDEGPKTFGTLAVPQASPNDPVFWLHHAQIDRLWAHWQERNGVDSYRPLTELEHNNVDDVMRPFDEAGFVATPADVADIRALGYVYDDSAGVAPAAARNGGSDAAAARRGRQLVCRLRL